MCIHPYPRVTVLQQKLSVHVARVIYMSTQRAIGSVPPAVPPNVPVAAPRIPAAVPPAAPAAVAPATPRVATVPSAAPLAAVPSAPRLAAAPSGPPSIGTVAAAPSQRISAQAMLQEEVYVPPTSKLPDPPEAPGKWQPQYSRDKKSYVVPGIDGVRQTDTLTRATSHAKVLGDSSNLTDWQLSAAVMGLARNPELLDGINLDGAQHLSELDYSTKRSLISVAHQAARRVGSQDGSEFGTKLHGYLEAVLEGVITVDEVPEMLRPYLLVIFEAMRRHRLNFVAEMCERTVFIPVTGMVGTFDFLVVTEDGQLVVGDLKTSNSIDYSWLSIGVQLGQYASAALILSRDGSHWEPMPAVSQVIAKVVSVPKDAPVPTARIYTVNLTLGMEMVEAANRVKAISEAARRSASAPDLRGSGDDLMAWADGEAVSLTQLSQPGAA